jgi:uncharacterized protein involved in response to NO
MKIVVPADRLVPAGSGKSSCYPVTPWSAQRLYRPFVWASLAVALTLGFTTGAGMLLAPFFAFERGVWWLTHAQAHGMAQLFGFAGLFTMGVAFHVVPRFRNGSIRFPWPQRLSLTAILLSLVLRFVGQAVIGYPTAGVILIGSGVLLLVGAVVFAFTIISTLRTGRNPHGTVERWILAGANWLVIASTLHMALKIWLLNHEASIAPKFLDSAVIYASLLGFVGSFIMGVSTRAVAGFMGLATKHDRIELIAFALVQAGLLVAVLSSAFDGPSRAISGGMLVVSVGLAVFVVALRIFESRPKRRTPTSPGAYIRFHWFIRCAYAWLLVGATVIALDSIGTLTGTRLLANENASPIIHIVTVGFVTSMIIGVGSRMLALFEGAIVPGRNALDVSLVLLNASVLLRTVGGFTMEGFTDAVLATSRLLGFLAIVLAVPALAGSMRQRSRDAYRVMAAEQGRVKWVGDSAPTGIE